ncbi:hypothetical protein [uncultured Paraglaciecola sp.]|uniref:hypothetical protein n=1 Tax=uncultured Paraglaciecola sp. TaxID=1765024 RepID=UPI0030D9B768
MKHYIIRVTQSIKRQNTVIKRKALIPLKLGLLAVKHGLAQESRETKVMLVTYKRFTKGQASKLEMQEANRQFVDVIRGLGLGVLAILPFAPITLPFVVKLGEKIGINVLPSAFMKDLQEEGAVEIQQEIEVLVESDDDAPSTSNKA